MWGARCGQRQLAEPWRPIVTVLLASAILASGRPSFAHHGGLVVLGPEDAPAVPRTWEQEVQSEGYRVKFLSEPPEGEPGKMIRLVFEVQRVVDGVYESGLTPQLTLGTRNGRMTRIEAPETSGVTGYYESETAFPMEGDLDITFEAQGKQGLIVAEFSKKRATHPYATLGNAVVAMASLLTLFGCLTSVYRRRIR